MPKVYRTMREHEGLPLIGTSSSCLGVRPGIDLPVDEMELVRPEQGGLSVSPSLRALPARLVPKRLRALVPGAVGKDDLRIWSHGSGPFASGEMAADLALRVEAHNERHGLIEPSRVLSLDAYQAALAATQSHWQEDER